MQQRPTRRPDGFSLIEVLTVVVIIGILAAIAVPLYLSQRTAAKDAAVKEGVHVLRIGLASYAADHHGAVPPSGDLDVLKGSYIDHWPVNAFTGGPMTWSTTPSAGAYDYVVADDGFTLKGWLNTGSFDVSGDVSSDVASNPGGGDPGSPGGSDPSPSPPAPSVSPSASATASPDPEQTEAPTLTGSFAAVSSELIERLEAYHAEHGDWPRSWASYPYTDLGLDPRVFDSPIGGIWYELTGSRILVSPAQGYVMTVTDERGRSRSIKWGDDRLLIYDAESAAWFYGSVRSGNRVDISTLSVTKK